MSKPVILHCQFPHRLEGPDGKHFMGTVRGEIVGYVIDPDENVRAVVYVTRVQAVPDKQDLRTLGHQYADRKLRPFIAHRNIDEIDAYDIA